MRFIGPLNVHKRSIETNPKATLITDSVILIMLVILLIAINVVVIINMGFNPILILSWILFGGIILMLVTSIVMCVKNIKKNKDK